MYAGGNSTIDAMMAIPASTSMVWGAVFTLTTPLPAALARACKVTPRGEQVDRDERRPITAK
jgi:hypothetical protein